MHAGPNYRCMSRQVQYQLAKGYEEGEAWRRAHAFTYNNDMAGVPAAVEFIRGLQASRGWPRTYLVGFSNGAVVATAVALSSRVDGVWLASGVWSLGSVISPTVFVGPYAVSDPSRHVPQPTDCRAAAVCHDGMRI